MRATIDVDPDLEVLLKLEAKRRKQPIEDVLRDAVRSFLAGTPKKIPSGAGAFDSGRDDISERAEELLKESNFGEDEG